MVVLEHSEMINPHYGAKSLDMSGLLASDKVANEETSAFCLDVFIMTFSGASRRAAGRADSTSPYTSYLIPTWTP